MFIVATLSYAYSIFKQQKNTKELLDFVENFSSKECLLDTQNLPYEESMKKPLFLLANAYLKSGQYSKSINLYLYLLRHTKDDALLYHLAEAYFLAGFLKRAEDVYLQILSKHSRDKNSLYKLEYIYQQLHKIDNATDALNALKNQNENVELLELNLKLISLKSKNKLEELKTLYTTHNPKWAILREIFKINPKEGFKLYNDNDFKYLIDILYMLQSKDIDLNTVAKHNNLASLYYIKNILDTVPNDTSGNFAIDLIANAKKCGFNKAELNFIYICQKCKNRYPIFFNRCPNCHRAYKINIEVTVAKKTKKHSTLQ